MLMLRLCFTVCLILLCIIHPHLSFLVRLFLNPCLWIFSFQFIAPILNLVQLTHIMYTISISGHYTTLCLIVLWYVLDAHFSPLSSLVCLCIRWCLICYSNPGFSPALQLYWMFPKRAGGVNPLFPMVQFHFWWLIWSFSEKFLNFKRFGHFILEAMEIIHIKIL